MAAPHEASSATYWCRVGGGPPPPHTQTTEVAGVPGGKGCSTRPADGRDLGIEAGDRRSGLFTLDDDLAVLVGSGGVEGQNPVRERVEHVVGSIS